MATPHAARGSTQGQQDLAAPAPQQSCPPTCCSRADWVKEGDLLALHAQHAVDAAVLLKHELAHRLKAPAEGGGVKVQVGVGKGACGNGG